MRRAALLFVGAALACGDPEVTGSTGAEDSSGATVEPGGTTVTPTTAPTSDTGTTADPPDPPDPSSTALVSTAVLPGLLGHTARVADGALGCDGRPALVGGISRPAGPDLEWDSCEDLWLARFTADGATLWTHEEVFGPPYSHGSGSQVVALPDGDLLVTGNFLGNDGMNYVPFMRRFAGG